MKVERHTEPVCDDAAIERLSRAIRAFAYLQSVTFVFESGITTTVDGDSVHDVPNGTGTFRLFVAGGAVDHRAEASREG